MPHCKFYEDCEGRMRRLPAARARAMFDGLPVPEFMGRRVNVASVYYDRDAAGRAVVELVEYTREEFDEAGVWAPEREFLAIAILVNGPRSPHEERYAENSLRWHPTARQEAEIMAELGRGRRTRTATEGGRAALRVVRD